MSRALWPAWGVLALALLGSLLAWRLSLDTALSFGEAAFERQAQALQRDIERQLRVYEQILHAAQALWQGPVPVTRQAWREFFLNLDVQTHFPGIQGLGYAVWVPPGELGAHEAMMRSEGFADYRVRPAGPREGYAPVVYLEPFAGRNLRAFGFDIYSEATRRAAMDAARDSGDARLSGKVRLVQEDDTQLHAGFLMYVPVYRPGVQTNDVAARRAALRGWVNVPFRMDDFIAGVLQGRDPGLHLEIFDGEGPASEATRLYGSVATAGYWQHEHVLRVAGHAWRLRHQARPEDVAALRRAPDRVLAGGVALALLLFAFTAQIGLGRARARHDAARLAEGEALLRVTLDASPTPLYVLDGAGRCLFANPACLRMLGYDDEQALKGRPMHALIHHSRRDGTPYPEAECPVHEALARHVPCHADTDWFWGRDGQAVPVELWATPLDLGDGRAGVLVNCLDLRERQAASAQAHLHLAQMQVRNLELAEALRARTDFLARVSHELRTPLNAILGFAELLAHGLPHPLPAPQNRYAIDVLVAARELDEQITALLRYARQDAGGAEPMPVEIELEAYLAQRLAPWQAICHGKDLRCALNVTRPATPVRVDAGMLGAILDQLLSNAIKFTPVGGRIAMRAGVAAQCLCEGGGAACLEIEVADSGPGIPAELLSRLFRPLARPDSPLTQEHRGLGLGLALAQRLAERMGGHLGAESPGEGGALLRLRLPLDNVT